MKVLRYFAAILMLTATGATVRAQDSVLSDPVKRNHFCNDHFSALDQWQQCHDMWPYGGKAATTSTVQWRMCEKSSINAGKLNEKKMADCLLQHMRP